jgi:hypothetical protein
MIQYTFNRGTSVTTLGLPVLCGIIKQVLSDKGTTVASSAEIDELFAADKAADVDDSPLGGVEVKGDEPVLNVDTMRQRIQSRLRASQPPQTEASASGKSDWRRILEIGGALAIVLTLLFGLFIAFYFAFKRLDAISGTPLGDGRI